MCIFQGHFSSKTKLTFTALFCLPNSQSDGKLVIAIKWSNASFFHYLLSRRARELGRKYNFYYKKLAKENLEWKIVVSVQKI